MSNSRRPFCISLILCDQVIQDVKTGKKTFVGVFNTIVTSGFPLSFPFCIAATLTNLSQTSQITIRIYNPQMQSILELNGSIQSESPLSYHDFILETSGIEFSAPGQYSLDVFCEEEHVSSRKIELIESSK